MRRLLDAEGVRRHRRGYHRGDRHVRDHRPAHSRSRPSGRRKRRWKAGCASTACGGRPSRSAPSSRRAWGWPSRSRSHSSNPALGRPPGPPETSSGNEEPSAGPSTDPRDHPRVILQEAPGNGAGRRSAATTMPAGRAFAELRRRAPRFTQAGARERPRGRHGFDQLPTEPRASRERAVFDRAREGGHAGFSVVGMGSENARGRHASFSLLRYDLWYDFRNLLFLLV